MPILFQLARQRVLRKPLLRVECFEWFVSLPPGIMLPREWWAPLGRDFICIMISEKRIKNGRSVPRTRAI